MEIKNLIEAEFSAEYPALVKLTESVAEIFANWFEEDHPGYIKLTRVIDDDIQYRVEYVSEAGGEGDLLFVMLPTRVYIELNRCKNDKGGRSFQVWADEPLITQVEDSRLAEFAKRMHARMDVLPLEHFPFINL